LQSRIFGFLKNLEDQSIVIIVFRPKVKSTVNAVIRGGEEFRVYLRLNRVDEHESNGGVAGAVAAWLIPNFLFTMIELISRVVLLGAVAVLTSCHLFEMKPDFKPHDKLAVVPQEFLFTTHQPFTDWLDTPVHIQISDVPLTEVFEHPALRDLRVVWVSQPTDDPPITVHRLAITRRQLLWALGQDHQLTMLAQTVPGGKSYVEIRPREPLGGMGS